MIEIIGINKKYGKNKVLQNISCDVRQGAITAFLGPNGSGKTTLLKTLLGLVRPEGGTIRIDNNDISNQSLYRRNIGYMAQIANYPDNLTAGELFRMVAQLRKPEAIFKEELIDKFSLDEFLNKPLKNLSGGTKQKVNAVMALMFDVPILILDEPTVGLDPESSRIFKKFITGRRDEGVTVVFSSHVMYDIEELADDVAILLEGKIVFRGNLESLKTTTQSDGIEEALVEVTRRSRSGSVV